MASRAEARAALAFAGALADAAAAQTLAHFRRPALRAQSKQDGSPVTRADKAAERAMRALIAKRRPQDGVLGEEEPPKNPQAEWVWVLDPIDGTRSFISGSPLYCVLVGLLRFGSPVLGVLDMPALGERWTGATFPTLTGAWKNGKRCRRPPQTGGLRAATFAATTLGLEGGRANARLRRLADACGQTRAGGDAFNYGCVASGFLSIAADYNMQAHDYLPLVPIVAGAGGVMSDWRGKPLRWRAGAPARQTLACANAKLARRALALLA